jgi:serine/threonine protein kinase
MSLEKFKLALETFSKSGEISEKERKHLYKIGLSADLDPDTIDMMIDSQMKFVRSSGSGAKISSGGSGFDTENVVKEPGSGFATGQSSGSGFESGNSMGMSGDGTFSSAKFSNEKVLASQGNMSTVSEAMKGSRHVIIKRLLPNADNFEKKLELLYKEFEFLSALQHDNIVSVYDKGEDEKSPFYYMEKVNGNTLEKKLSGRKMNGEEIRDISLKVLDALKYLHDRGIIHRDLKPANIMVNDKTSRVKLIDLGLAYSDEFTDNLSKPGTPKYMAPEMKGENDFDKTTDIYAFGLILLEMFTKDINQDNIPKVKPVAWQNVINKCLKPEPKARYQFCQEIIDDIKKLGEPKASSAIIDQKEKAMTQLLDKYFADGILNKEEKQLLFTKAEEIDYPAEKLQMEITRRKKEVAINQWDEKRWQWVILLIALGLIAGIMFCIFKGKEFWSYLYIPIIWALVSASFAVVLNLITKKIQKLPSNYSPVLIIILVLLYTGLNSVPFIPAPVPTKLCSSPEDCLSKNLFTEAILYAERYPKKKKTETLKKIIKTESATLIEGDQYDDAFNSLSVLNQKDKEYPGYKIKIASDIVNALLCKEALNSNMIIRYLSELNMKSKDPILENSRVNTVRNALLILLSYASYNKAALEFIKTLPADQKFSTILTLIEYQDDKSFQSINSELAGLYTSSLSEIDEKLRIEDIQMLADFCTKIYKQRNNDSNILMKEVINGIQLLDKSDRLKMYVLILKTPDVITPFMSQIAGDIAQEVVNTPSECPAVIDEVIALSDKVFSEYKDSQSKFLIDQAIGLSLYLDPKLKVEKMNMILDKCLMKNYIDLANKCAMNLPEKFAIDNRTIEIKKGLFRSAKTRYDDAVKQLLPGEEIEPFKGGNEDYTITKYQNIRAEAKRRIRNYSYSGSQRSRLAETGNNNMLISKKVLILSNARYIGETNSGKAEGLGTVYYFDGTWFYGTFKDQKKNGKGTLYMKDVSKLEGEWTNDLLNGLAIRSKANGETEAVNYHIGEAVK